MKRPGLFLPLRLASYVIIMVVVIGWMQDPHYLRLQTIVYSALTLAFAVSLALERRFALQHVSSFLIALQFAAEVSIELGVIYATGNVNSPFSALLVLTIVSAALAYRLFGTLIVAGLVSLGYAFVIWLGLSDPMNPDFSLRALNTVFSTNQTAFYAIILHVLIFYLTAFMSGYLAERLRSQDEQLADASRALRRARLETDDILRNLNSGLLTVDSAGYIVYFNHAAERILGYAEEQVRGMRFDETFAERMPALSGCLSQALNSGITLPRRELTILKPDGETIPLGLSTSVLTEEAGELRGVIAIFSDLTEAKELEEKVRANDRLAAIGELSASIAHEIRNPLAAISGSVEVLQNELRLTDENGRLMELILKESARLNVILNDFLSYARIGRPAYNKVEVLHVVSEVRELLKLNERVPTNVKLLVETDTDAAVLYAVGDEGLLKQLLMNLAMNAVEAFDGEPGQVVFRVIGGSQREAITLQVVDNGPGIPQSVMSRLYEPFFSTKKHGTGLGLAIVHRICDAMNLGLTVDSSPEKGTAFALTLHGYIEIAQSDLQRSSLVAP